MVWNIDKQKGIESKKDTRVPMPDILCLGHTEIAPYALAFNNQLPIVASGGHDNTVLVWNLHEHFSSGTIKNPSNDIIIPACNSRMLKNLQTYIPDRVHDSSIILSEYTKFVGHKAFIEGVAFNPVNENEICSVSVDKQIILWDCRSSHSPISIMADIHKADINCIDWCRSDENLIGTGSSDKTAAIIDRRKLAAIHKLPHDNEVTCIQFMPNRKDILGTSDMCLRYFDLNANAHMFFKHCGHKCTIVDFDWSAENEWSVASVSDDSCNPMKGGGTLNVHRLCECLSKEYEGRNMNK